MYLRQGLEGIGQNGASTPAPPPSPTVSSLSPRLLLHYFQALHDTGNEDMCYYNFECAHPLGVFTAFNNIISNIGYVMLGLLFLGLTARR